jgi:DNA-directed RNA polymerase
MVKLMKIITAIKLKYIRNNKNVSVAGLVILRQRPRTANGVVFLTLEDETGTVNIIIWDNVFKKFQNEIVSAQLLRIDGRIQRDSNVIHVVAKSIKNLSYLLDLLPKLT